MGIPAMYSLFKAKKKACGVVRGWGSRTGTVGRHGAAQDRDAWTSEAVVARPEKFS